MDKVSLFFPLALEYDLSCETFDESFGVTLKEKFELLKAIHEAKKLDPEKNSADVFVELVQAKEISSQLFMSLANIGCRYLWDKYGEGVVLTINASEESQSSKKEE